MGWQDAPVVEQPPLRIDITGSAASPQPQPTASTPAWMNAPAITEAGAMDRAQAAASGVNRGALVNLPGLPVATALNVLDLLKAGAGVGYHEITGKPVPDALTPTNRAQIVGSPEWIAKQIEARGGSSVIDPTRPEDATSRVLHAGGQGVAAGLAMPQSLPQAVVSAAMGGGATTASQLAAEGGAGPTGQTLAAFVVPSAIAARAAGPRAPVPLDPAMQARVDAMRAVGIDNPPLPAVTRSPQDWYNYVELGKKEGAAKNLYTTAEEGINRTLSDVLPSLGGDVNQTLPGVIPTLRTRPATPYANAETARQTVAAYEQDARNVASGTYEAAGRAPGAEAAFPAGPFFKRIESVVNDFEDAIPGAVMTRLRQLKAGMDMSRGVETPGTVPRDFTIGEATKLYQLINDRMSTGPAAAAGRAMKSALADVGESAAGPTVPQAGNVAMQLFKDATSQWRTMKQTLEPAPLAKLADTAEAHPDFYPRLFTSGKPEEIVAFRKFLQENNPAAASGMRDALLSHLQDASMKGGSFDAFAMNDAIKRVGSERLAAVLDAQEIGHLTALTQTGMRESVLNTLRSSAMQQNGRFSGVMLGRAMDRIGPERLSAVFSPADLATLQNLRTASHALTVEPNLANVNRSNTGSTLGNMLQRLHVGPVAGAGLGALFGPHTGLPQFVPEMLGAGVGGLGERFAAGAAGRRMEGMVNPDLQALARSQQPSLLAQMLTRLRP